MEAIKSQDEYNKFMDKNTDYAEKTLKEDHVSDVICQISPYLPSVQRDILNN